VADSAGPSDVGWAELRSTGVLLLFFVANILLAALFASPFRAAGLQAFEDPQDVGNSLWYLVLILAFTFLILWIAKRGHKWLIRLLILGAVGSTVAYVVLPLAAQFPGLQEPTWEGIPVVPLVLAVVLAAACVFALYRNPEWYVIDAVGLLVASASSAIFGISLGVVPVLVLLAALAAYDAIAVYRTKHMLSLADTVIELRLPVLLVIPKHGGYRFRRQAAQFKQASAENKHEREAMFMGLGDLVMPTILVVCALAFLPHLTALPMEAHELESEAAGLPLELEVASAGGHPAAVTYRITSPDTNSTYWEWSLDRDGDGTPDHSGAGLPAQVTVQVAQPELAIARAHATSSGMAQGWANSTVQADYTSQGWHLGAMLLFANLPAMGAAIGTLVGFGVLMAFVLRGNPQAGLPLLNGGAIAGFLVGLYAATGSFRFW
jgi:presenilin-like A22 family membrane protease